MILKIGISGKRIINDDEKDKVATLIEANIRKILSKNNATEFTGYSALAIGADTIFADVVVNTFKMPLQIVLPLPVDEYRKDFTNDKDILKFNSFVGRADKIEIVSNTGQIKERNEAYFSAGQNIIDNCDEVIFVWDGLKPGGKGGTAEIIGYYAENKNKVPVDYILTNPVKDDDLSVEIANEYKLTNTFALQARDNYKLIWKLSILLGWLAVVLFAVNTAFAVDLNPVTRFTLVCLEFLFVSTVFILILKAKRKDYHGNYLSKRLRAETLRLIKYFYHSNIEIKVSDFTLSEDKELSTLVQKINQATKSNQYTSKWYANYSIKSLIEYQKSYHKNKISSIGSKFHFFEQLNLIVAILFMVNLILHLINAILEFKFPTHHIPVYNHNIIVFMNILLPATYAAIEGAIYFQEWALLKKISSSAEKNLDKSLRELPANLAEASDNICFEKQSVTLNLVSSIMLTDNKNWHLILEDKNNYHWVL